MAEVRLQKLLSERGIASRRKAEELIEQGKVKVNGHVARLGDKADDRKDIVTVAGKRVAKAEMPVYLMLYKPRGYITTMNDERGRRCVAELVADAGTRVYPVGRLDRDSEGLLLLTNDGDFANAIMHPRTHIPKYYRLTLRTAPTDEQMLRFAQGIELDGRKTAPAEITLLLTEPDRAVAEVVLYEGRNRQIRRMCETLGLEVLRLKRTAVGSVKLGMLQPGKWRHLDPKEVKSLLQATIVPASPSEGAAIREREGFPAAACLILRDGAEPAGYVCYQIEGSRLELLAVRGEDGLLLEGLVRAALNAGELEGASEAFCRGADPAALLERLGFQRKEEELSVSIRAFFSRPCRGGC